LDLLLHLRYEVISLLLGLKLGELRLLPVMKQAFFFGLEGSLAIVLGLGIFI